MADPFSIFTGAITIADVCVRIGEYLKSVKRTTKNVDQEIESLEREIQNFNDVYHALGKIRAAYGIPETSNKPKGVDDPFDALWARAAELVKEGKSLVERLKDLLTSILGTDPAHKFNKLDDVRKAVRLLSRNDDYTKLRSRFTNVNMELNMMLTAIDLTSNALFRSNAYTSLEEIPNKLSQKLQELGLQLKSQISALEKDGNRQQPSILSAKAAVAFTSLNEHFYVKQPDTSIWTGRKNYLNAIMKALLDPNRVAEKVQRRFVVHGMSGAGKTQLCCKFAQDYRESFWGIFWVDASSPQNASESWKKIAKIGSRDANEEAGKHWLSNLHSPWLLIIDSADNSEDFIGSQFPSGERGCILITTRNPRLRINATVGSLALEKLEENEANDLLRKATKHEPWDGSARISASSIAKHLGYLPLALIHAGRAIFHQLCTLHGYIPYFNRFLNDLRLTRPTQFIDEDDDEGLGAFTSFDIIYSGIEAQTLRVTSQARVSRDAIELINIFAFLHSSDIRLEILVKAGKNIQASTSRGSDTVEEERTPPLPLLQRLKTMLITFAIRMQNQTPVLPKVLHDIKSHYPFDEPRARKAVDLLVRMSLVSESSESGSYSMHPLVHLWVRKRLSAAAQALWCETAANVLATSVKLPPLVDEEGDQDYHLRILPHVHQVQGFKADIKMLLQQNRDEANMFRGRLWLTMPATFTVSDALTSAKYSRVYMECAKYSEAEDLQRLVQQFIVARLGDQHPLCVRIQLALAATLWHLGRAAEAQELQEKALNICRSSLGQTHSQTLKIMDSLGETYWQRGRLKEAKAVHEAAIDGMKDRPTLLRDRLKAMSHLGRVHEWYVQFEKARELHEEAFNGLSQNFGAHDLDSTVAADALAMVLLLIGGAEHTRRAYNVMQNVYESRYERLGREHVYTLWAACNYARAMAAQAALDNDQALMEKAKGIFGEGLEIAERNLGPDHFGTLMGRTHLANTWVLEKKYDDAEKEFRDLAERQKYLPGAREGTHRDRIMTMQLLVKCYELQDRFDEGIEVSNTIIQELDNLGGQEHPWRQQIKQKQEDLISRRTSQGRRSSQSQGVYLF